MALISLSNAQLAFGHHAMLDRADFSLEPNERVGLIGRNGTGKSSLLKILAGKSELDDGLLVLQQGVKIAYVEQEPTFEPNHSIFDAVSNGLGEIKVWLDEYDALATQLGGDNDTDTLEKMLSLQAKLDASNAWSLNNRVETTLDRLGLDRHAMVSTLSGGMKKRVALARGLVSEPDILLLDEPTNHLDVDSILWLEGLLRSHTGSILLITHDRDFLNHVATRIVELDRGKLLSFPGNFSAYKTRKAEQLEAEGVENAKFDKFLAQEEVWIRKGIQARRTRDEGRVKRLESLRTERAQRRNQQGQVKMDVSDGERSGKIVSELVDVSKSYGDNHVIKKFSATIQRGDKVGLIGANGTGKTTLLRLILGEESTDTGSMRQGSNIQIAYFDQMRAQLDEDATLLDTISPGSEWIEIDNQRKHVMSYLNDFLFSPERARSPVKSLSGGERNRLLLARLFARPANVLVLDEPTNDLDIDTLELLEELLENYSGTLFLVSHDRAFLNNVVTQVIAYEGEGHWREYVGGYSDWERAKPAVAEKVVAKAPPKPAKTKPVENAPKKKLSYKVQRELDELPDRIAALEAEQQTLSDRLADAALYLEPNEEVVKVNTRFAEVEEALLACLERWEEIESQMN